MQRGDIISYTDMTINEGMNLQRGMNFNVNSKGYHIMLMSVRPGAPYADEWLNDGKTLIYEGHDIQKNHNKSGLNPDQVDQPMRTPNNNLTENGKFFEAAENYIKIKCVPNKVKVYEKLKPGIWVYNGFFSLTDAYQVSIKNRKVFKFKLEMNENEDDINCDENILDISHLVIEHNRLIPSSVKLEVWKRDKGCCVKCSSEKNLHYDHIIPFSKGGSSVDSNNIQLLCQKCNLQKSNKIE